MAKAQKLNTFIVNDHFTKLTAILKDMELIDRPVEYTILMKKDAG